MPLLRVFLYGWVVSGLKAPSDVSHTLTDVPDKIHGRIIYHQGEYDKPISLADIQKRYPKVSMVIAENGLEGKVYRYGNNKDENGKPLWEEVGKTQGYA